MEFLTPTSIRSGSNLVQHFCMGRHNAAKFRPAFSYKALNFAPEKKILNDGSFEPGNKTIMRSVKGISASSAKAGTIKWKASLRYSKQRENLPGSGPFRNEGMATKVTGSGHQVLFGIYVRQ